MSILRIVPSRDDLRQVCHFASDLYACTALEARQLDATCTASGEQWRLVATASIQPVVYLWDTRWLAHEKLHVADIAKLLAAYLELLTSFRYDTESDCRRAADAEIAGFTKEVDVFSAASNELRHPKYAARNHRR